jgi:hypothetical protein
MLCCFGLFFPSFEHAKNLLIMGPNNTKNSSLKCNYLIFNYGWYCQNLVFIVKKTPNLIKKTVKLFLCCVSKPRVGPISSQYNNFKSRNIFSGICTLVLSLCLYQTKQAACELTLGIELYRGQVKQEKTTPNGLNHTWVMDPLLKGKA